MQVFIETLYSWHRFSVRCLYTSVRYTEVIYVRIGEVRPYVKFILVILRLIHPDDLVLQEATATVQIRKIYLKNCNSLPYVKLS